jgi:hypothetical protein
MSATTLQDDEDENPECEFADDAKYERPRRLTILMEHCAGGTAAALSRDLGGVSEVLFSTGKAWPCRIGTTIVRMVAYSRTILGTSHRKKPCVKKCL